MFKLHRLEITGFKSFADYTEIVFTGNGITSVVGPNSCGKSNVSDAISWVLGEQRAKTLRGEEMKDVIFQGTGKRNPGGMAEVVLHLERDDSQFFSDEVELEDIDEKLGSIDESAVDIDIIEAEHLEESNSDSEQIAETVEGLGVETMKAAQVGSATTIEKRVKTKHHWKPRSFALDFAQGEAVAVTRRLYLSGESEYLLNDKACRLRDIQDLFSGTGLSGSNYAIIEQGRIGQILSSKPQNRRNLIEEAAGISKFRKRQRAAESRLETAKSNLARIFDIESEVEKRVRSLRRQANKTKRFKVLRDDLRELQAATYSAEGTKLFATLDALKNELKEANDNEKAILERVSQRDKAFRLATDEAREAEENLTRIRALHARNDLDRDRSKRDLDYQKKQIEEFHARSEILETEVQVSTGRVEALVLEIERLEKELAKESENAGKEQEILRIAQENYHEKLDGLRTIENSLESERSDHLEHTSAVERLTEVARQFENTLEKLNERKEALGREEKRADEVFEARSKEFAELEKLLAEENDKLQKLQGEKTSLISDAEESRNKFKVDEEKTEALREIYSRNKHRFESLEEIQASHAIYEPSVQKLFEAQDEIGVRFSGVLADRFDVKREVEDAVENLFGAFLQAVLVNTEKDALRVIKYLNENRLGRIPVLVIDETAHVNSSPPKDNSVAALLGISAEFEQALFDIFPREMSAKVVSSVENAGSNSGDIVLSRDGDLVVAGKLFISGRQNRDAKKSSLLGFKRELEGLAKNLNIAESDLGKAQKTFQITKDELAKLENELVDLQAYIVKVEHEHLSKEIQTKSADEEIKRAERHKQVVQAEAKEVENEIIQTERKRSSSLENAKTASKAQSLSDKKIQRISEDLRLARDVVEKESSFLGEKRTFAEVAAERKRSTESALIRVRTESDELASRLERQVHEKKEIKARIIEIAESNEKLEVRIEGTKEAIGSERVELDGAITHLKSSRETADSLSEELGELNKKSAMARDERAGLEIAQAESATRLASLDEKCVQDLKVRLSNLIENHDPGEDFDLEESLERREVLRNEIENFGAINMLALEELGETEERLEFLTTQRQDIVDSIEAAESTLDEIKRRSRQRFMDAFEAINENFSVLFNELFGGGVGAMKLLEAEDILESGIEIVAQPPGKKLQNMLLLSGGEKAMTAIALILAIFKYRPSPFCLLDEVDAPLDDVNVGKFVDRIAEMSENTQFIVITHNKKTMESAKALYGVTMEEPGVSKIVSVKFE